MPRILLILGAIALHIYTFIDVLRTDRTDMPVRLPKFVWVIVTLIVPILGPLLWLALKNQHLFRAGTTFSRESFGRSGSRSAQPRGPVAPDDDPDFLARLEAQNRRRAYQQQHQSDDDDADAQSEKKKKKDDEDDDGGLYGRSSR